MRIGKLLSGLALSFALLFAAHLSFAQLTQTGSGGRAPGAPWSPLTVSSAFWYDASDAGSTHNSSGVITTWDDISGNARHLTQAGGGSEVATLVSNVKNSLPGILFTASGNDGAVLTTTSTFSVSSPNTIVLAFVGASNFLSPGFQTVWGIGTSFNQAVLGNGGLKMAMYGGTTVTDISVDLFSSTAYIVYAQFNGSSSHGGVNSGAFDFGPFNPGTSTISSDNIQIGRTGASNIVFRGHMLELFGFPGVNNTDRDNAIMYITGKWGSFP